MRVGIDLRPLTLGSSGGIVQHLQGVLQTAFELAPQIEFTVYCTCFNRSMLAARTPNVRLCTVPLGDYYRRLAEQLRADRIDILFRSYPDSTSVIFPENRQVVFIPDIQHEAFPEFFEGEILRNRRINFNHALLRTSTIGTNSQFTLRTIIDHPWTRSEDVFTMSPSCQMIDSGAILSRSEADLLPQKPYFYFPANLWPHKNHRRLFQAFQQFLAETGADVELVLTGHPRGWEQLRGEFPALPVRHLGFVSPALVRQLYAGSLALTFFSLYEGFGMPLLEAFDAGTAVLCSNTTSLPEVGGEAVLSCDPSDVPAISSLMKRIYLEKDLRPALVAAGKGRLGIFTWESSARSLIAALERVEVRASAPPVPCPEPPLPLVTIVTPSYNQAVFLRRTIDSVLNQTYPRIQYLVMDGGSSDGSREILESYGERFTWVSEPDHGQANAVNKGMRLAKGEILAYLNSDDTLEPDGVEKAVRYLLAHPECDLVYGQAHYIDEEDRVTGEYRTAPYSFARLVQDNPICQPAAFWRARIAHLAGPFDEKMRTALDHEYWMRIDRLGGCIQFMDALLANSRLYAANKTMSMREVVFQEVFEISRRHAGRISDDYYIGYWYHLVFEKQTGWPRLLRHIPRGFITAARFQRVREQEGFKNRGRRWLIDHLKPAVFRRFYSRLLPLAHRLPLPGFLKRYWWEYRNPATPSRPVKGLYPEGTLESIVKLHLGHRPLSAPGYLAGWALVDTGLKIYCGKELLLQKELCADEYTRIDLPALPDPQVRLVFDRYRPRREGVEGGLTSFFLADTNLFSEAQAYR